MGVKSILDQIPQGTTFVSLLGRHTHSVQEGDQLSRTITKEGVELCHAVWPFYRELFAALIQDFDVPAMFCSEFIRSTLTVWEITHHFKIVTDPRLDIVDGASLKTLPGGWYKSHRFNADGSERSVATVLKDFFADDSLDKSGPFDEYASNYRAWAADFPEGGLLQQGTRFRVAFAHEIGASLAAGPYLAEGVEPGLEECESYLICYNDDKNILAAIKIVPDQQQ